MTRKPVLVVLAVLLAGCSFVYARLTYDFLPLPENTQILYEPGAQELAKLVAHNLAAGIAEIEKQQYVPFKNVKALRIYVFNDRQRYSNFSHASILTRGSSTMNEVYLSERLREKIDTLPSILVHELSHVHVRQYTGTLKYVRDIPGWFSEGLAVAVSSGGGAENVTAAQAQAAIQKAVSFTPDAAGSIFGARTAHNYGLEPHMYYRQASLFVDYLRKSKPESFRTALVDILKGASFRQVWPKYYGLTISELWSSYEKGIEHDKQFEPRR
jgi:hypothetical protein